MKCIDIDMSKGRVTIGRAPGNDYRLNHPLVSNYHAQLFARGNRVVLQDLKSREGSYVNGYRITAAVFVGPQDVIQIGPARFKLFSRSQVRAEDLRLTARVDVHNICYDVAGRSKPLRLLHNVAFTIVPGELVALMGPAGAGKTTLIENINGNLRPSEGQVLINGVDLHHNFNAMRGHIGYVPQEDIVHRKLTVYEACYFTARMRMKWVDEAKIEERITEILAQLDILHLADRTIGGPENRVLSGGQRKRLNLAMEMVTDPALLFLDEPTSGLSSADAAGVMKVLASLRDAGRTIIITIHQPSREIYEMMNMVVILGVGGRLIYYGPVIEAYERFRSDPNPDALFEKLSPKGATDDDWIAGEAEFRKTKWYQEYVVARGKIALQAEKKPHQRATRRPGVEQFGLLLERLAKLYLRDVGWLIGAVMGAPLLMAFLTTQLNDPDARHTLLFVAVLLAYFFGIFPSIEMIQSETTIYHRERMVNLKLPSYVLSKLVFLTVFGMLQACFISVILVLMGGVDTTIAICFPILLSVQLCGAATGLCVSTISRTNKVAMMLMLACIILMIAFSGFLIRLPDLREDGTGWLLAASPMRWGLGGLMDVVHDVPISKIKHLGFENESWSLNVMVNLTLCGLITTVTLFVLRIRDKL